MSRKFEPWKVDRSRAMRSAILGASSMGGGVVFALNGNNQLAVAFGAVGLVLLGKSSFLLRRAKNREFGKRLEERFAPRAAQALTEQGIQVRTNVMIRGIGDIDLVAHVEGRPVPVEIKSFQRWSQFLFFMGERERKTVSQVRRQKQAIDAPHAIIWLPQGRPTLLQLLFGVGSRSIRVVFGNEKALLRALDRMK